MKTILAIAAGGGLGSVLRYGVAVGAFRLLGEGFPWATLFVNVAGSFVIGLLTGIFAHVWQPSAEVRVFLITGLLGGFTTFSAFSLDTANLWQSGAAGMAMVYAGLSVVFSILAVFAGLGVIRILAV